MLNYIEKGGIVMIPILACSLISLTIVLERLYVLLRARRSGHRLWAVIEDLLRGGKWEEALTFSQSQRNAGPLHRVIARSFVNRDMAPEKRKEELLITGAKEMKGLEKHLWFLSLIADIAPLLGLLGTVTGMVKAFMKIEEFGGRVDASLLAGGIWEALITTVAGLSVAIPTMVAYHYLERMVSEFSDFLREVMTRTGVMVEGKD
ncbi:MAG: MotA/TolQ/ExbB proton channel family protein [Proteobacteria bacterium]|nr:MotA/TolQ/ExbB proton channel family protein [Pseudomonadota bacterium]